MAAPVENASLAWRRPAHFLKSPKFGTFMNPQAADESQALMAQARHALARRDPASALKLIRRVEAMAPSVAVYLDLAAALRMTGELAAAAEALDRALALEPRNFLALLSKGAILDRIGRLQPAAALYRAAVAVAPSEDHLPSELREPLARAKQVAVESADRLARRLQASVAELRGGFATEDLSRFDESLQILAGRARPYVQQPMLFHYPRLPAIPFYDRDHFPWLDRLEAATPMISAEAQAVISASFDRFKPYIAYPPGAPVDQWADLNHNPRWSTFFLWKDGVRQTEACESCPQTAALLDDLPLTDLPGYAPTVVFSVLDAKTRIPPHTGSSNIRLIGHLPLILPGPAWFRVGAETKEWRMGDAWVFDDTIEHEASNEADSPRTIMIFDVWNPFLTDAERVLVSVMMRERLVFEATG